MDVSKEFILMCDKAVEVQREWKPAEGDYYYDRRSANVFLNYTFRSGKITVKYYEWFWLPRQDQLQGMIDLPTAIRKLNTFINFCNTWENTDCFRYEKTKQRYSPSMEQLWLAFVMSERYGKIWNGTNWIKEDKICQNDTRN
jgi:hypothetical protein